MVADTLEQAMRMEAPRAIALCRTFCGFLDFHAGEWEQSEAELRRAIDQYRTIGTGSGEARARQNLGALLTAKGELERAFDVLHEGLATAQRSMLRAHCLTRLLATLARNRLAAGDAEEAARYVEDAKRALASHGNCTTCGAVFLPETIRVALARGRVAEAEQRLAELQSIAERFGTPSWIAMAKVAEGRVLEAKREPARAATAFGEAAAAYQTFGAVYEAARAKRLQAGVLRAKEPEVASALEAEALQQFRAFGAAGIEH
jgi:tetratricopeptide (TPR) repeat protein